MCRTYERSDLAEALAAHLKGAKLDLQPIAGVSNRFFTSWKKGEIAPAPERAAQYPCFSSRIL
jgi:hypothetical protein